MAVLDTGKVAAEQSRAAFDIALRKTAIASVRPNHFTNIYLGLLFRHSSNPDNGRSIRVTPEQRKNIF
jgi:hypothetical protein